MIIKNFSEDFATVSKNGKTYKIKECSKYWSVSTEEGELSVQYKVDKKLCDTEQSLRDYILSHNEIF